MSSRAELTPLDVATFLAGKAIAEATAFLQHRGDEARLAHAADQLCGELLAVERDPACNAIVDPTRLLVTSMMRCAVARDPIMQDWCLVMFAFVGLLRRQLREGPATDGPALAWVSP
jgi:hypothetical protein